MHLATIPPDAKCFWIFALFYLLLPFWGVCFICFDASEKDLGVAIHTLQSTTQTCSSTIKDAK